MKKGIIFFLALALCTIFNSPKGEYSAPRVTDNESSPTGTETVWDAVYFGEYPAAEVVSSYNGCIDEAVLQEGDIIVDVNLFGRLENAYWTNNLTVLDGIRYYRVCASDIGRTVSNQPQHYAITDVSEYHYFRFEPIKWRILDTGDGVLTLMAGKALTAHKYNENAEGVYWENSTLRSWLNGYDDSFNDASIDYSENNFIDFAFSDDEQKDMKQFYAENAENYYFGTFCGDTTQDFVCIPSESDVLFTDTAFAYGFTNDDGTNDPVRRFSSTTYAKFTGTWWSMGDETCGNVFWGLRTNGYTAANNVYICEEGYGYNRGIGVNCDDIAVIPIIKVAASSDYITSAGTISSLDIIKGGAADTDSSIEMMPGTSPASEYKEWMKAPVTVEDESFYSGQQTTWTCLNFGSYPKTEIVNSGFNAVDDYALQDGDYLADESLYSMLERAEWDKYNTTLIDGVRYKRLSSEDTSFASVDSEQHYRWNNLNEYHYFRFDPIRWRIADIDGDKALIVADRGVDCRPFNETDAVVSWEESTVRSWLNAYTAGKNSCSIDYSGTGFFDTAFTPEEQNLIVEASLENKPNSSYGTYCGEDSGDKVFLMSMDDVFLDDSTKHGFVYGDGIDDPARRFTSTLYAKARGSWWSPVDDYKGNSFWFMRTSGYTQKSISYICDFGYIYPRGTMVTCDDACIVPAMWIKLDPDAYEYAGERLSTEIIK